MLHDLIFEPVPPGPYECTWLSLFGTQHSDLLMRREYLQHGDDSVETRHMDFYALYIVRGGKGVHWINGQTYLMTRGDAYIMPPRSAHKFCQYDSLEIDAFYFRTRVFRRDEIPILRASSGFWRLFVASPQAPVESSADYRLHLSPQQFDTVSQSIAEMRSELTRNPKEGIVLARNLFFRLMVWLARWSVGGAASVGAEAAPRKGSPPVRRMEENGLGQVLSFCEENFHKPISVPQLAAMIFVSPGYFYGAFKNEFGVSPAAYVRSLRIENARHLLRSTRLPIHQIAAQSGFADTTQFSRAFQKALGIAPGAYRKEGENH